MIRILIKNRGMEISEGISQETSLLKCLNYPFFSLLILPNFRYCRHTDQSCFLYKATHNNSAQLLTIFVSRPALFISG